MEKKNVVNIKPWHKVVGTSLIIPGLLIIVFGISLLLSLPAMWLWNWLMPIIFGLPTITLLQTLGLQWLIGLLFSNLFLSRLLTMRTPSA